MAADGRVSNATLQAQISAVFARLDRMGEDLCAIKTAIERLEERIRLLENSQARGSSRMEDVWKMIDDHEKRIRHLSEAVTELRNANRIMSWIGALLGSTVIVWLVTQILGVIR